MNDLFIRVYFDEDVDVLIAKLLKSKGHFALTTQEVGRIGRNDDEQLQFAANQGLAIVSHNRDDFAKLAADYLSSGKHMRA